MNKKTFETLEWNKIIATLKEFAISDIGSELIDKMKPSIDPVEINRWLEEVTEVKKLLSSGSSVPLHSLKGVDKILLSIEKESALKPNSLSSMGTFLKECTRMKKFLVDRIGLAPTVASYGESLYELDYIYEEIIRCITGDHVVDRASSSLTKIRKKISICDERIKTKINSILKSSKYATYLQDRVVSQRYGRYVVPVKSEYRAHVTGDVIDKSSTGSTLFIEPKEIKNLQSQMNLLRIDEDAEIYQILCYLTGLISEKTHEIKTNVQIMGNYDFLFAKGKYSNSLNANQVKINTEKKIIIKEGRHPLLGKSAVPLNFRIGENYRALVITGPNTGGKTVALKTVGLFSIMVQHGLHIPADKNSTFSPYMDILVDIGDGQSIENSLSTFSSHIKNIIDIINVCHSHSLVIIDEVGTGTDPGEGMGLATAILEKLYDKGVTLLATTHFSEIKDFALKSPGFQNGSMEFDINTLKPKYKLNIGESGDSNAFLIALRLGMNNGLIERAHEITYKEKKSYTDQYHNTDKSKKQRAEIELAQKSAAIEQVEKKNSQKQSQRYIFSVGDCVKLLTLGGTGIVVEAEDRKGMVTVLYKKKKLKINQKRLALYIDSKELYPDEYDMDIVTETKENRKKDKILSKKHVKDMEILRK